MKKLSSKRLIPVGVGVTTLVLVGVVVGVAQIPAGDRTAEAGAVSTVSPSDSASDSPAGGLDPSAQPTASASAPESKVPDTPGPGPTTPAPDAPAPPAGTAAPSEAAPSNATQPAPTAAAPAPAPAPAPPAPEAADAQTVQRVTDSCSVQLKSDAAKSGVVAGPQVGRPYTVVSLEFTGAPQRSTASSGLASYDVLMRVTTQTVNGPVQTSRRVCRVYDYDSHVDWLPAG